MEEKNITTKNKYKIYLPIIMITLLLATCLTITGITLWNRRQTEELTQIKEGPNKDHMSLDEIAQLDELVNGLTEEEIAELKAEAEKGVKDELTLRKLLLLEDEIEIKTIGDIEIIAKMPVKGTKKLTGDMQITLFLGASVDNNSILEVTQGANLTVEGMLLDANGVANAILVSKGANLNYNAGTIQYAWYGIKVEGTLNVTGGTIQEAAAGGISVAANAKAYVSGGEFLNSDMSHFFIARGGNMEVTDGTLDGAYAYPIMNYGTFTMTGGTIRNGKGINSHAIYNEGNATLDGGEDYIEISDCFALFYVNAGKGIVTMNKVYGHDFENYIGHVKEGSVKITNSKLENAGERGIIFSNTVLGELENVTIKNTKSYGIHARYPSVVNCKNVDLIDIQHTAYENAGAVSTLENVNVIRSTQAAFCNTDSSYNGTDYKALMTLKNCTASESKHNVFAKSGATIVAKNCVFYPSTRTNVYVPEGTVDFENVKVYGSTSDAVFSVQFFEKSKGVLKDTEIANGLNGVYCDGQLTMTGGSIHGHNSILSGGGLVIGQTGKATISDVQIYNNIAKGNGGGVQNNGELNAIGVQITDNSALGPVGGGALHVSGKATSTVLKKCVLSGNVAQVGGAVRNTNPVTIEDSEIKNNTSETGAGAIYNGSTTTLKNVNFDANKAKGNGGAIQNYGKLEITGGCFNNNKADGPVGGGAIHVPALAQQTTIDSCTFSGNSAMYGGAIRNTNIVTINGGSFESNHSTNHGGAIYNGSTLKLKDVAFVSNTSDGNAGAIRNDKILEINGGKFVNNTAAGTTGGGAIHVPGAGSSATITNCDFVDNKAQNGSGGAIRSGRTLSVVGGTFSGNSSAMQGGAVYLGLNANDSGSFTKSVKFSNNSADAGGALYVYAGGEIGLKVSDDVLFNGNQAKTSGGAIVLNTKDTIAELSDVSFGGNEAGESGRDIYAYRNAMPSITNATFDNLEGNIYLETNASGVQAVATLDGLVKGLNIVFTSDNIGMKLADTFEASSTVTMTPNAYQNEIPVIAAAVSESNVFADLAEKIGVAGVAGCTVSAQKQEGYLAMDCVEIVGGEKYPSLAKAIAAANNGDTIKLLSDFTVGKQIDVTKSVTITNENQVTITASEKMAGDLFHVQEEQTLTIAGASKDAAIIIDGNANTSASDSRAVYVEGTFVMENGSIQNFYSKREGAGTAVYNKGTTTLTNVAITDNKSTTTSAGGALRNQAGTLTIADSAVGGSETKGDGGALYAAGGTTTNLTSTVLEGNKAGGRGGAIYYNGSNGMNVNGCTFIENNAGNNGGAMTLNNATIADSTFESNTAPIGNDVYLLNSGSYAILSGTLNGLDVTYGNANQTIRFAAGYNSASEVAIAPTVSEEQQVIVNGGIANSEFTNAVGEVDLISDYLTEAWMINQDGCLVQTYCAQIGDKGYYSIAEAVKDAKADDTIIVLRSITMGSPITIDKSLTLTSNEGVMIKRGLGVTGAMFNVTAGTFTIAGAEGKEIVIDGNAEKNKVSARAIEVATGAILDMQYANVQNFHSTLNAMAVLNKGTATLENTYIYNNVNNSTGAGGVLRNEGTMSVSKSVIEGTQVGAANGGALFASGGAIKTTLDDCQFIENSAMNYGGAVYYNGTKEFIINGCTFTNNSTTHATDKTKKIPGAAIAIKTAIITDTTFSGNTTNGIEDDLWIRTGNNVTLAGNLDGLTIGYEAANNEVIKIGGEVTGNVTITPSKYAVGSKLLGATETLDEDVFKTVTKLVKVTPDQTTGEWGIDTVGCLAQNLCASLASTGESYYSFQEALAEAGENDVITMLRSFSLGETIEISKTVTLTSSESITITRTESMTGNMFTVKSGTFKIQGTEGKEIVIDGNAGTNAVSTRAVEVVAGAEFQAEYTDFENFNSSLNAMILLNNGTTTIKHANVQNNVTTLNSAGGAMRSNAGAKLTVEDSLFNKNTHSKSSGGVIYATGTSETTFTRCTFTENEASKSNGGAIHYNGSNKLTLTDCTFSKNSSKGGDGRGGAIYNNRSGGAIANIQISGCTFTNNSALTMGGAICVYYNNTATAGVGPTISNTTFSGNEVAKAENDVQLFDKNSYITVRGKIKGLTVVFYNSSTDSLGVKVGGTLDVDSDITLVPAEYKANVQLVHKLDSTITDAVFEAAIDRISVAPNGGSNWKINTNGYLSQ